MIELVLFVCLAGPDGMASADCREVHLGSAERFVDQASCGKQGMIEAARWLGEHPGFALKSFRCGPPRQDA